MIKFQGLRYKGSKVPRSAFRVARFGLRVSGVSYHRVQGSEVQGFKKKRLVPLVELVGFVRLVRFNKCN